MAGALTELRWPAKYHHVFCNIPQNCFDKPDAWKITLSRFKLTQITIHLPEIALRKLLYLQENENSIAQQNSSTQIFTAMKTSHLSLKIALKPLNSFIQ
jgi:hypothetical protein